MQTTTSHHITECSGESQSQRDTSTSFRFLAPELAHGGNAGEVWKSESFATEPRSLSTTLSPGLLVACGVANASSRARQGDFFQAAGATFALAYYDRAEVFDTQVEPGDVSCVGVYLPDVLLDDDAARIVERIRTVDAALVQRISPTVAEVAKRLTAPLPGDYGEAACRLVLEARGLELLAAAHSLLVDPRPDPLSQRHRRIAGDASAYINENLAQKITISELGRAVAASPRTLTEAFRKIHGETIASYVTRRRMEHASALLRAGYSVSAVALAVSYSPNAFSHAFRHYSGLSPRDFATA
ncbi:MAG: helix-turn-helix domain-containing protein [Pseudomonadota bacterium]